MQHFEKMHGRSEKRIFAVNNIFFESEDGAQLEHLITLQGGVQRLASGPESQVARGSKHTPAQAMDGGLAGGTPSVQRLM